MLAVDAESGDGALRARDEVSMKLLKQQWITNSIGWADILECCVTKKHLNFVKYSVTLSRRVARPRLTSNPTWQIQRTSEMMTQDVELTDLYVDISHSSSKKYNARLINSGLVSAYLIFTVKVGKNDGK